MLAGRFARKKKEKEKRMYTNIYDDFMIESGFSMNLPEHLYYYTDSKALINIFENSEIWLTHVKYFNDGKEYYDGVDLIIDIIDQYKKILGNDLYVSLQSIFKNDQWKDKPLNVGVMSLSAQRDLLSQWRGYTKFGQGFCLGFKTSKFYSNDIRAYLRPCIYDDSKKIQIVEKIITKLLQKIEKEKKTIDEIWSEAFWLFQESAITFKNKAFSEEEEWRIITIPYPNNAKEWCFRSGNSTIIPYIKNYVNLKSCLDEVIIGPSQNQELSVNSLFFLMFKNDIWKNNINKSIIPYRNI